MWLLCDSAHILRTPRYDADGSASFFPSSRGRRICRYSPKIIDFNWCLIDENCLYKYPCRSRMLMRAKCCWTKLFMLLNKYSHFVLFIYTQIVFGYFGQIGYFGYFTFTHFTLNTHFTIMLFVRFSSDTFPAQSAQYLMFSKICLSTSPSSLHSLQGLPRSSPRPAWWSP